MESHFKLEHAKVKACAWKIYQVVMGRMDWKQSGLKPTAMVQHGIMKLLTEEQQPDGKGGSGLRNSRERVGAVDIDSKVYT